MKDMSNKVNAHLLESQRYLEIDASSNTTVIEIFRVKGLSLEEVNVFIQEVQLERQK